MKMKIKNILSLLLCLALLMCTAACKKSSGDAAASSALENVSSEDASSTTSDNGESSTPPQDDSLSAPTQTDISSTPTQDDNTSSDTTIDDFLGQLYNFKSIKTIDYYCAKNLPDSDAIYAVSSIITDADTEIGNNYSTTLSCKEESIKIEYMTITIPRSYIKTHDSVTITARHNGSGVTRDFEIEFEDDWKLLFEDNFDGTTLNTDVWNVWDEKRDWRYSYLKDNLFLDGNGNLINRMEILETPDAATGESKTSGAMTTQGTFETTYGYFETRLIAHRSPGLMGAFWLMCGDMGDPEAANDGTAKNGCEIDIIETFYHAMNPAHTIHWDGYKNTKTQHFHNSGRSDVFDGKYHTYAFLWTPDEYVFFIDGKITAYCNTIDICTEPGYLLISSHFNNQAGEPNFGAGEHTDMTVDYVKVYKSTKY